MYSRLVTKRQREIRAPWCSKRNLMAKAEDMSALVAKLGGL